MSHSFTFGGYQLFPERNVLLMNGEPVHLGAPSLRILVMLVEQRGRPVAVEELLCTVWPNRTVEISNVSTTIRILRRLLGSHAIATVVGQGFRFALPTQLVRSV